MVTHLLGEDRAGDSGDQAKGHADDDADDIALGIQHGIGRAGVGHG